MLFILHMSSRDGGGVGVFNIMPTQKRKKDKIRQKIQNVRVIFCTALRPCLDQLGLIFSCN